MPSPPRRVLPLVDGPWLHSLTQETPSLDTEALHSILSKALKPEAAHDCLQRFAEDDRQALSAFERNHLGDGPLLSAILGRSWGQTQTPNDAVRNFIGETITPLVVFDRILYTLDAGSPAHPVARALERPQAPEQFIKVRISV